MTPKPRLTKSQTLVITELRSGGGLERVNHDGTARPWLLWSGGETGGKKTALIYHQTVLSLVERGYLRLIGKRAVLEASHAE